MRNRTRPSLTRSLLALSLPGSLIAPLAMAEDLFVDSQAVPAILTATRLKQAPAAVPGSVTVLDRELIKASGARDIPELMRLVPGMMVGYLSGNQTTVNYHGTNVTEARRMQVLVDGRSVYRPGLATVDWTDIPVALEDIERIEVFRGPNSMSYGSNALMGVISIVTRSPADSKGTRIKYTQGQRGIRDWYASQGSGENGNDFRLSLSGQEDDGFDKDENGGHYRDSRRLNRVNLSVSHVLDSQQTLDWQLAAKEGTNQRPYDYEPIFDSSILDGDDGSDIRARDYAGSARWTMDITPQHSLYVQGSIQQWERKQKWTACEASVAFSPSLAALFTLNPGYVGKLAGYFDALEHGVPLPGTAQEQALAAQIALEYASSLDADDHPIPVCGMVNQDIQEMRYDLEVQDTFSLSENLRLVSGFDYRYDRAESETFFNGSLSNQIWRLFGHLEWRLDEHWLLQGGAMFEQDQRSGDSLTPRIALNYLITPRHGLRAVYSEAVRSPDMYEDNVNWRYRVRDLKPQAYGQSDAYFFLHAYGPGNLEQEIMRSRELGYNGLFETIGLNLDAKLFYDEISQMISEPLRADDFYPTNNNSIRFRGAETQLDWRLTYVDRLRLTYAYVDYGATSRLDQRLTARNSGSAGWMHDWGCGWSSSLFYYGADQLNRHPFSRMDLRIAKRLPIGSGELELSGMLQQRLDREPMTWPENRYDERHLLYFSAELGF